MTKDAIIVQSQDDVRLQKYRSSMLSCGNAMILFALWAVVRTIIQLYHQSGTGMEGIPFVTMILPVLITGGVDTVLKFIVGFSARAEGLGKHKNGIYIVLGIILAALTVFSLITWSFVITYIYKYEGLIGVIVSMAVEITVLYAEVNLVISAIKARKLENERDGAKTTDGRDR